VSEFDFDSEDLQEPVSKERSRQWPTASVAFCRWWWMSKPGLQRRNRCSAGDCRHAVLMDDEGMLYPDQTHFFRVEPFAGANIEAAALEFTGIKLDTRCAWPWMSRSSDRNLQARRKAVKSAGCTRAVLVGHIRLLRPGLSQRRRRTYPDQRNPFHPFSCFDTATLGGLVYGQTVLAKACAAADIDFDARRRTPHATTPRKPRTVLQHRQSLA